MTENTQTGSKTGIVIGAIGGLIVLLLVAAVAFGNEEPNSEYGEPIIEGTSLPIFPDQVSVDVSIAGTSIPDIYGEDYEGSEVTITDDGRAKAVLFLAHWCSHCQVEVPRVQEWIDSGGGVDGVDLYSVSTAANSGQPNYPASEWLRNENWSIPVIVDDKSNSVFHAFGGNSFPYWVFINADGTVAVRTAGELAVDQLEGILNTLVK